MCQSQLVTETKMHSRMAPYANAKKCQFLTSWSKKKKKTAKMHSSGWQKIEN